jgi:hypothetical protein
MVHDDEEEGGVANRCELLLIAKFAIALFHFACLNKLFLSYLGAVCLELEVLARATPHTRLKRQRYGIILLLVTYPANQKALKLSTK